MVLKSFQNNELQHGRFWDVMLVRHLRTATCMVAVLLISTSSTGGLGSRGAPSRATPVLGAQLAKEMPRRKSLPVGDAPITTTDKTLAAGRILNGDTRLKGFAAVLSGKAPTAYPAQDRRETRHQANGVTTGATLTNPPDPAPVRSPVAQPAMSKGQVARQAQGPPRLTSSGELALPRMGSRVFRSSALPIHIVGRNLSWDRALTLGKPTVAGVSAARGGVPMPNDEVPSATAGQDRANSHTIRSGVPGVQSSVKASLQQDAPTRRIPISPEGGNDLGRTRGGRILAAASDAVIAKTPAASEQVIVAEKPIHSSAQAVSRGDAARTEQGLEDLKHQPDPPGQGRPRPTISQTEAGGSRRGAGHSQTSDSSGMGNRPVGEQSESGAGNKSFTAQLRAFTPEPTARGGSTHRNGGDSGLGGVTCPNSPSPAPETHGALAHAPKPVDTPVGGSAVNLSRQIQESVSSSLRLEDHQITVRLNPPELGKVSIKISEEKDQISGLLEVTKVQTKLELQQALPEIVRNLQDMGIQIKRLEVLLADEQGQSAVQDHLSSGEQNGPHRQGDTSSPNMYKSDASSSDWALENALHNGFIGPARGSVTDVSINVLA